MKNYKPYSYLYKRVAAPKKLKSNFICWVPKLKKLSFNRLNTISGKTTISYDIVDDLHQTSDHYEKYQHEFLWDGNSHEVEVIVGSGSGANGGEATMYSDDAEIY